MTDNDYTEYFQLGRIYNANDIRKLLDIHGEKFPALNALPLAAIERLLYNASEHGAPFNTLEETGVLEGLQNCI